MALIPIYFNPCPKPRQGRHFFSLATWATRRVRTRRYFYGRYPAANSRPAVGVDVWVVGGAPGNVCVKQLEKGMEFM